MAKKERLEAALIAADAAGDTDAATLLAQEIRNIGVTQASSIDQEMPSIGSTQTPSQQPTAMQTQNLSDLPVVIGAEPSGAPILQETAYPDAPLRLRDSSFEAEDASTVEQIKLAAGFLLNANPESRIDMLRNVLGEDARFEKDDEGRDIVSYGGERAYVNKPGFDSRDALQLAGDILKFLPAAKIARWFGGPALAMFTRGTSGVRAALGGGAAAGITQAASDIASENFGSEQGVDPVGVVATTLGGAGGELLAGRIRAMTPAATNIINRVRGMGIDPATTPGRQVAQVANAAREMSSPEKASALPAVAAAVKTQREAARRSARALYEGAEQRSAAIPAQEVSELRDSLLNGLDSYDLGADGMSAMNRSVINIIELADESVPFPRRIQALERWRKRVSGMRPKDGTPADAAARQSLGIYDEWLDGVFNRDMVRGDATAIDAWKNARRAWSSYQQRFNSNTVVRDLAKRETTPEQMSQWIFNANAVGAKKEAGLVVERLNNILGADSQAMAGLRTEVVLDIAEPLFRDTPDIQAFITNYGKFLDKNPTLNRTLFPDNYGDDLADLYKFAKSIAARAGSSVSDLEPFDIGGRAIKLLGRLYLGHGIARGSARIEGGNTFMNFIRRRTSGSRARVNLIRDYLGIEPQSPLIPVPAAIGAGITNMEDRLPANEEQQ
tara:strand:- start:32 stop:2047 length:2016 start_codon:yes stop_codon:yes gene_type:complete